MGLLMNHLSVDNKLREVFDAGDAVADEQDLDEEEGDGGMIDEIVQLDKLRSESSFFYSLLPKPL